jgi:hypothetical protein
VAPEVRRWAALGGRESVAARASSGGSRWGMELTAGNGCQRNEGEATDAESVNQKGKCIPVKTRPMRGLGGPAGAVLACGGSEASGLAGPKAGWAARSAGPKIRKKNF